VYDRFGLHYEHVKELLSLPGVDYYPFTGMAAVYVYNTNGICSLFLLVSASINATIEI
jgi:hypothetical protein